MDAAPREIQSRQPRPRPRPLERGHPAVRGAAVEGAARRREQGRSNPAGSVVTGRPARSAGSARGQQPPSQVGLASTRSPRASRGALAGGRGVDEAEQALGTGRSEGRRVAAILRADIDRGVGRQSALAQVVELRPRSRPRRRPCGARAESLAASAFMQKVMAESERLARRATHRSRAPPRGRTGPRRGLPTSALATTASAGMRSPSREHRPPTTPRRSATIRATWAP